MDSQINAVIDNLCTKFDVSAEYLVPRMQAYKMAMCQFGFITAAVFGVAIGIFLWMAYFKSRKRRYGIYHRSVGFNSTDGSDSNNYPSDKHLRLYWLEICSGDQDD